jgi:transcriptional regulator of acetoin/glycerol metabolism
MTRREAEQAIQSTQQLLAIAKQLLPSLHDAVRQRTWDGENKRRLYL